MLNTGAYTGLGPSVLGKAVFSCIGPYKIPHIKVEVSYAYTNKALAGAYRRYGIPQVCWLMNHKWILL